LDPLSTDDDVYSQLFKDADELIDSLSKLEMFLSTTGLSLSDYYKMLKTSMDLILLATRPSIPIRYCGRLSTDKQHFEGILIRHIFPLLKLIFRLPELPDEADNVISLIRLLRQLEPYLGPGQLGKLLFLTRPSFYYINRYFNINLALLRVLLEAGADPNAVFIDDFRRPRNNTLLHFAAALSDRELGDAAGLLLVEFGAKPHLVNMHGKSALDIWIERNEREDNRNEETGGWSARPEWTRPPVPKLERQAARVIRANKIPYIGGGIIPPSLEGVVESRKIL